jgi:hypothetical protein
VSYGLLADDSLIDTPAEFNVEAKNSNFQRKNKTNRLFHGSQGEKSLFAMVNCFSGCRQTRLTLVRIRRGLHVGCDESSSGKQSSCAFSVLADIFVKA